MHTLVSKFFARKNGINIVIKSTDPGSRGPGFQSQPYLAACLLFNLSPCLSSLIFKMEIILVPTS